MNSAPRSSRVLLSWVQFFSLSGAEFPGISKTLQTVLRQKLLQRKNLSWLFSHAFYMVRASVLLSHTYHPFLFFCSRRRYIFPLHSLSVSPHLVYHGELWDSHLRGIASVCVSVAREKSHEILLHCALVVNTYDSWVLHERHVIRINLINKLFRYLLSQRITWALVGRINSAGVSKEYISVEIPLEWI